MSFTSIQDSAKVSALAILKNGTTTVSNLQTAYAQHFSDDWTNTESKYSQLLAAGAASSNWSNGDCQAAVSVALQMTDAVNNDLTVVEQYITWNIPKMEDGNNFGVTVQLQALKHVQDVKEKLIKGVDELVKYSSLRAEALEKCKHLASTSTVTTSSKGTTQSQGGKEGDSNENKTAQEEKATTTATKGAEASDRLNALVAVDASFWFKAKVQVQAIVTGYVAALDFMEKNATKIALPKGEKGSPFSHMY